MSEEIRRELYESVAKGMMKVTGERDGEPLFSITEEGEAHVESMLDHYLDELVAFVTHRLDVPDYILRDLLFKRAGDRYRELHPDE